MPQYTVAQKGLRDLADIWTYISLDSPENADKWLGHLYEIFALLSGQPRMGLTSDAIYRGSRKFPVGNYVIYYRIVGSRIHILRVIHGKRNQWRAFRGL